MKGIKKSFLEMLMFWMTNRWKVSLVEGSGSSGSSSGSGHDYCNDICTTDSNCGGSCTHCVKVPKY